MIRIDHVNLVVTDMERAIRFYGEVLDLRRGFEVILEGAWIEVVTGLSGARAHCVFMETDDSSVRLELLQYFDPVGTNIDVNSLPHTPGLRHVAFTIDDLDAVIARLREKGVLPLSDPVEVPFAVGSMGRKRLCYFHDPDGTLLEIAAYG